MAKTPEETSTSRGTKPAKPSDKTGTEADEGAVTVPIESTRKR
jgi:hypothetical protein